MNKTPERDTKEGRAALFTDIEDVEGKKSALESVIKERIPCQDQ